VGSIPTGGITRERQSAQLERGSESAVLVSAKTAVERRRSLESPAASSPMNGATGSKAIPDLCLIATMRGSLHRLLGRGTARAVGVLLLLALAGAQPASAAVPTVYQQSFSGSCSTGAFGTFCDTPGAVDTDLLIGPEQVHGEALSTQLRIVVVPTGPQCVSATIQLTGTYFGGAQLSQATPDPVTYDLRQGTGLQFDQDGWYTGPWHIHLQVQVNPFDPSSCPGGAAPTGYSFTVKVEATPLEATASTPIFFPRSRGRTYVSFQTTAGGRFLLVLWATSGRRHAVYARKRFSATGPQEFSLVLSPSAAARRLMHHRHAFIAIRVYVSPSYGTSSATDWVGYGRYFGDV
jgi:hypothetical protein